MKIGDKVIIKECHKYPEFVGKEAIVQDIEPSRKYPIGVEPVGEPGTLMGFREDELSVVPSGTDGIPPAFLEGQS